MTTTSTAAADCTAAARSPHGTASSGGASPVRPSRIVGRQDGEAVGDSCIAILHPRELYAGYTGFVLPLVTNSMKCSSQAGIMASPGSSGSGIARARMASRQ